MEQLYAFIQKTPNPQKAALLGMVVVLIGVLHYFMIYQGQADTLKQLAGAQAAKDAELQEKREIASNLPKFIKEVENLQLQLEEKKKNLPDDVDMDKLLRTLNDIAEKTDIRITQFIPKPERRQNFYAEIPVEMSLLGNYKEIVVFFDKVAMEERIINISNISMKKPTVVNNKVVLEATCLAKTFRALAVAPDQPAPAAAPPPPPAPAGGGH